MVSVIISVAVDVEVENSVLIVNGYPVFKFDTTVLANIAASNIVIALDTRAQCERR
jgi:hypothetical protein